jgi:TatD DNase family protein
MLGTASCHSLREYEHASALRGSALSLRVSFGVHPQEPLPLELENIERLASEAKIDAIGECGFDFFDERFARTRDEQARIFQLQVEIAKRYGLPLVLHLRKAMPEIYSRAASLKGVRALIFHSWPGSPADAKALLKRGLNAYFSIGAQAMNGRRLSVESIRELPLERILVETDAPYQKIHDPSAFDKPVLSQNGQRTYSNLEDLRLIYNALAAMRGIESEYFIKTIEVNFFSAFGLR